MNAVGIEDRIRQEVNALSQETAQAFAAKLKAVSDQLAAAAAEDRSAIEAAANARFAADLAAARDEAERTQQAAVANARSEAEQRLEAELDRVRAEADRARAEVEERLAAELERSRAEADAVKVQTARLTEEFERLKAEAANVKEEIARVREAATSEHEAISRELEAVTRDKNAVVQEKETALRENETLARQNEALLRDKEAADREREIASRQVVAEAERRAAEREATIAGLDRLASTFRRIDASSALADILGLLADAAAAETARVALFVTAPATPGAPPRFKPWRLHGFPTPPNGFDLGLTNTKELARTGLSFAPLGQSRAGVAIPIDVGGQTVAMVYADDGDAEHPTPAGWPEAIELVARHAASRIEAVTAVRTAQVLGARTTVAPDEQSARRYAKLLVSEIKMYNESAVKLGRNQRDLYERLRPEIDRARRLFEERVPALGARQAFDDELVQTLADGDATLLGTAQQARRHA
ncbi:MAG TPA: hypothetical protein VHI98_06625 [Vicinamibacterales bacterium]|nr:hypothetical protein [Vicinamibacterales bacterium]